VYIPYASSHLVFYKNSLNYSETKSNTLSILNISNLVWLPNQLCSASPTKPVLISWPNLKFHSSVLPWEFWLATYVRNLGLIKIDFIEHVQQLRINSGSKQNIEHEYERIYDMFDLSKILRIMVLGIPGWSFDPLNKNNSL